MQSEIKNTHHLLKLVKNHTSLISKVAFCGDDMCFALIVDDWIAVKTGAPKCTKFIRLKASVFRLLQGGAMNQPK